MMIEDAAAAGWLGRGARRQGNGVNGVNGRMDTKVEDIWGFHPMFEDVTKVVRQSKSMSSNTSVNSLSATMLDMADLSPRHPSSPSNAGAANNLHSLYKTELCRSWEETGSCRYGTKCQFAHGQKELRPIARHPKYKTEICRTFATNGTCPYGTRCRFIHYITSKEAISGCKEAKPSGEEENPQSATADTWTELLEEPSVGSTTVKRTQSAHPRLESESKNSNSSSRRLPIFERLSFRDLNTESIEA